MATKCKSNLSTIRKSYLNSAARTKILIGKYFVAILLITILPVSATSGVPPSLQRTILVKGDLYYPPFEFINEKGEPDGFNVELFRELARELHLDFKIELGPWDQVRTELENGRIDVIMGKMISPERAEKVLFGIPHSVIYPGIFTRKKSKIHSMDDIRGKEVIVQKSDRMHDYLIENSITDKIITVSNQMEALKLLDKGKYDAAIIGKLQGAYLIRRMKLKNIVANDVEIEPQKYTFAVNLANEELLDMLNSGLYQLKANGTYDKLYDKWFYVYDRELIIRKYTSVGLTIISVVLLMLLFIIVLKYKLNVTLSRVKKQKNFLETLINTMPNPVVYIDYSQKISGCNKAFESLFRKPEILENFEGCNNEIADNQPDITDFLSEGNIGRIEKKIAIPSTGEVRDMIIQEADLKNEKGEKVGLISILTDITETKNIERELEIHRDHLEKLIDQRTSELNEKNRKLTEAISELERMNQLFVGREFRIKDLKDQIRDLKVELERLKRNQP